jgi:hypothetical protein
MRAFYSRLLAILIVLLCATLVPCQQTDKRPKKVTSRGSKTTVSAAKSFEVEKPIALTLTDCKGEIEIPSLGVRASSFNLSDGIIRLVYSYGNTLQGSVVAYSQSAYYIDANIGVTFGRTDVPFSDPNWKPPTTISFRLFQNRKKSKQLFLQPVPSATSISSATVVTCARIQASSHNQ